MVKQLVKIVLIAALFGAICAVSCAKNDKSGVSGTYPSVASIAGEWLEIKRELNTDDPASCAARIEDFRLTVERFFASPVGSLYQVHMPGEMRTFETVIPSLEQLKTAVLEGAVEDSNTQAVFSLSLEIDTSIDILRNIDESLSDTSLLRYFQLFFFFSILIIIIILALRMLHSRVDTAEKRERQSLSFSRETIIAQEQERGRIARELHDTVAQDLWRLSFQTDSIGKTADAQERSRLCAEVVSGQKELMRRIRAICDHLIPPDFQRRGLADTLGSLCYNFQQRTGIECQLTIQKT